MGKISSCVDINRRLGPVSRELREVLLAHTSMETAVTHEACATAHGEVAVGSCRGEIWDTL